jgi:hypothetical protein
MTVTEPVPSIASAVPTALDQTSIPIEDLLHSANAGMIIHRTGQLEYAFSAEGRQSPPARTVCRKPRAAAASVTPAITPRSRTPE